MRQQSAMGMNVHSTPSYYIYLGKRPLYEEYLSPFSGKRPLYEEYLPPCSDKRPLYEEYLPPFSGKSPLGIPATI